MRSDDPSSTHLERAKLRASELLVEQSSAVRAAAEAAALEPYGDDPLARQWVAELARRVAVATLNAVVAIKPAQYRGANGDYVTVERLKKLRDALDAHREKL